MPILGINDRGGGPPKSGIPVRLPPQNICDVNPYVCRMIPASIDFKSEPPFVGKLSFEPHPRGCQCCSIAEQKEREAYQRPGTVRRHYPQPSSPRENQLYKTPAHDSLRHDAYERPMREPSITMQRERSFQEGSRETSRTSTQIMQNRMTQQAAQSSLQREPGRTSLQPGLTKKQKRMQLKNERKFARMERQREKRLSKHQKKQSMASHRTTDHERVRLLREQKRRDDFVTACCTGLLLTPCPSAGSCSEEPDEREQANFYIQCKCCPATNNATCENHVTPRKNRKRADFPCQCRNCKYQDEGCTNRRTGCLEEGVGGSTVCYCTDEDKADNRLHRVCDEQPYQRGARTGQRGFYSQGDGTVCDQMMPTRTALLTCNQQDGDGTCTKMVVTAELMQDMLIKQAQQGIQLANSLLTNKKFQLVDVTVPGSQNVPLSQIVGQRSQNMQTSGSSRSTQPVELNNPNLKCYLQNIDPPDTTLKAGSETDQHRLGEPLPRPPLNPDHQPEPSQDDSLKMNSVGEAQFQPPTLYRQLEETGHTSSYHGSSIKQSKVTSNKVSYVTSNQSNSKMNSTGEYPPSPLVPKVHSKGEYPPSPLFPKMNSKGEYPPSPLFPKMNSTDEYPPSPLFQQSEKTGQAGQGHVPYQGSIGSARQPNGAPNGITGHICIPRDALLQDPMNPKLCIPLSFDPRLSMGSDNCPFESDHAQAGSMLREPGFMVGSSSQRRLQKGDSRQKSAQGSHRSLTQGSQYGFQEEVSRYGLKPGSYHELQQHGSNQGLTEGSRQGIQKQDSRQMLEKESSRIGQQDQGRQVQEPTCRLLQEGSPTRTKKSSRHRDSDRDRRRRDSDRERRGRDPDRERRKAESDSSPERSRRRSSQHGIPRQKPPRQPPGPDIPTTDSTSKRRRKRSISPCVDAEETHRKGSSVEKRRPSPSEMVRTLDGYETDLLQAMDKVKDKYLKKRGNETSSSKGSSLDSMTPGLAEFNCLLKHITCLRKELKKYSKGDTD